LHHCFVTAVLTHVFELRSATNCGMKEKHR
jgi:hypothetical protein